MIKTIAKIDAAGRLVIPNEVREVLDIKNIRSYFLVSSVQPHAVCLEKMQISCFYCGAPAENYRGCPVCRACLDKLKK